MPPSSTGYPVFPTPPRRRRNRFNRANACEIPARLRRSSRIREPLPMKAAQSARVRSTRSGVIQKPGSAGELIRRASTQSATVRTLSRVLVQSLQQLGIARILIEQLLKHNARLEQELLQSTHREEQARRLAYRDALTGLTNRTLLRDRFSQATSKAKRHRKLVAML